MSDDGPYIVVTFGDDRWFVVHLPTRKVLAECRDEFAAVGIAAYGQESVRKVAL